MSKNNFKSLSKVLMSIWGIVLISKILGFAKHIVMASAFGASIETDMITLAHTLVSNTDYLIGQTLTTAFIPIYISVNGDPTDYSKKKFISNALKLFLLISGIITCVLLFGAPFVSRIIAPTYENQVSKELASYIRILSPMLLTFVLSSVFGATLNAHEKYLPGASLRTLGSLLMIGSIFVLASSIGTDAIIVGMWTSTIISTIFLGLYSKKYWAITSGNPFKDHAIIKLLKMSAPLLFGYAMIFINQQIDKMIVSSMEDGTVTAMSYGNAITQFVITVIAAFCMVMYTRLSILSAQGEHKHNANFIIQTLSIVFTLLLPITVITVLCSKDIVKVLFEHGAFNSKATISASYALAGYGLMFIPYTLKSLFSRYLYSFQNTRGPVRNNVIGILFNIGLSLALFRPLGVFGVTFASSVAELVTGVLNIRLAKRINPHISFDIWIANLKYWFFGSLICILSILGIQHFTSEMTFTIMRFFICMVIGLLSYSIPCYSILKSIFKVFIK